MDNVDDTMHVCELSSTLLQSATQAHRPSFEGKAPERGHWKMQRTGKGKTIIGKLAKYDQRKVKLGPTGQWTVSTLEHQTVETVWDPFFWKQNWQKYL